MSKEKRSSVIFLKEAKKRPKTISRILKMPLSTVYSIIKRHNETGSVNDRFRSGRPLTSSKNLNIRKIKRIVKDDSQKSMRKIAKNLSIHERSVRRIIKNNLGYKSYKLCKGQFLTEKARKTRFMCAKKMLKSVKNLKCPSILFTDEKIFTIEKHHNHQNDRQLLPKGERNSQNSIIVTHEHFPASVMVWGGIALNKKTPLVFVERGTKINAESYQDMLKNVLLPWANDVFKDEPWILQQDWAPSHSAKSTMKLCNELFPIVWDRTTWPPYSPDLNPMDFSVWSILEQRACHNPHDSVESLKESLLKEWDNLTYQEINDIIANFQKRLQLCIQAKGAHFKNK